MELGIGFTIGFVLASFMCFIFCLTPDKPEGKAKEPTEEDVNWNTGNDIIDEIYEDIDILYQQGKDLRAMIFALQLGYQHKKKGKKNERRNRK